MLFILTPELRRGLDVARRVPPPPPRDRPVALHRHYPGGFQDRPSPRVPNPDFSPPVWKGGCGCETLECGSLLPLSCPRACLREFQPRAQFPASKLACAKAAASCRTPKRAAPAQALGVGHRAAPTHQPQPGGASSGWREASPKSSCLVFLIEQTPQASTYYPSQRPGI